MIIVNIQQRSEAWYAIKAGRVTGTRFKELAAGLDTDTFKNLITDLAGELITGEIEESYSNAIMERGIELEPEARGEYENVSGTSVTEVGFIMPDEDNEFNEWVGISPDGLTEDGMTEFKCPIRKTHLNYIIKGTLPSEYRHQVQGQLFVTGLPYCDFMSYYPKMKPFIIRVYPDLELFKFYEERLRLVIKEVKAKIELYNAA